MRICLVTTEFHGLFKNGGIGTANTGLARELAAAGHEVVVAYVDPGAWSGLPTQPAFVAARALWRERGVFLDVVARWSRLKAGTEDFCWGVSVLEYLKARRFDVVLFNECGGQGYYALLAKRAGTYPGAPRMIVVTHGASEWARELNGQLAPHPRAAALALFERRSVELADFVVSPSRYLVGWMHARGWRLPERVEVLQNLLPIADGPQLEREAGAKIDEIAFFGRLEARKGLEIFCDALDRLNAEGRLGETDLTFVGKFSRASAVHSGVYLLERSKGWPVPPRFLADLGQEEALAYLKRPGVLAVMPSLAENSPCVIAECLLAGVPFLATDSGGAAELVAPDDRAACLVAPDPAALAAGLARALGQGQRPGRMAEPQARNRARWRALVENVADFAPPPQTSARVSFCISVRAGADVDAEGLASIRAQTHADVETVVVVYGANEDRRERDGQGFRIWRRSPDRASARNHAAEIASGDWLSFAPERDFALAPDAAATLLLAAQRLGADAVTGFAFEHRNPRRPSADWDGEIAELPLGPCLALAPFENCLGDDVYIVSRHAFQTLGGFGGGAGRRVEDRLLLTRALAAGLAVDLAPAVVAWRRADEAGRDEEVADLKAVLGAFATAPLGPYLPALECLVSTGARGTRARAEAWTATLDETARDLALKLTFDFPPGAPGAFAPFVHYCLARGRLVEALDFARRHDAATLVPLAEAALARETERLARGSLRAADRARRFSLSLNAELVERLRIVWAPESATLQRDAHCVASVRLSPGLTAMKAPLVCPPGAERLEAFVDFAASGELEAEVALAAVDPSRQLELGEADLDGRPGFHWSGWRPASLSGVTLAVDGLPAQPSPLDVFLLARTRAMGEQWTVWRGVTAKGSLSALATPSALHPPDLRRRLPLHLLERAELLTEASDFPYPVWRAGDPTLHHPLAGRAAVVRIAGGVPAGAAGVAASFYVTDERAHPIAFAMWVRSPDQRTTEEAALEGSAAASGWTICSTAFATQTAEARLQAPAPAAMDLYLATKVVGFDDVAFCHAYWREIAAVESLKASA